MTRNVITVQHDQAIARTIAHACRDRKRQLLGFVDDEQAVTIESLMNAASSTVCDVGHDILFADLMKSGVFEDKGFGELSLSRTGNAWLMNHGQPSPDWTQVHSSSHPPLRDWQVEALDAWAQHGRHGVVQAVTGTGKSRVGVEAAREALADDYSVVVCVPTVELVEQWVRSLSSLGVHGAGRAAGEDRATLATHEVLVGTIQTLYRDPPLRDDGKVLLIADECHRYGAREWSAILEDTYRRRLGLTATFERNDDGLSRLLGYFGGGPVFDIDFSRAIEDGVIAHYDVKVVGVSLAASERWAYDEADQALDDCRQDLARADVALEPFGVFMHEVTEIAGDEDGHPLRDTARRYLKEFSKRTEIVSNARAKLECVDHIAPLVESSRGALVFTRRVDTSEVLAERLVGAGVRAKSIHSDLTRSQRQGRLSELRRGAVKALVAPTVLDEGVDVPDIDLAVVMGGSRSRRQMIQRMGRVLRLKRDGRKATFVVVYAKDTVEDITQHNGVEGCLDLITASADSVQQLRAQDLSTVPATRLPTTAASSADTDPVVHTATTLEPPPVQHDHRSATSRLITSPQGEPASQQEAPGAVRAVQPEARARSRSSVEGFPGALPSVRLTYSVLDQHVHEHGGSRDDAQRELTQLIADLAIEGRVTVSTSGTLVIRRAEYTLIVDQTGSRFVRYKSGLGRITWTQFRRRGETAVWAQRPVPEHAPRAEPVAWDEPGDFVAAIAPGAVRFSRRAFRQAARLMGLLGRSITDDEADATIRDGLRQSLTECHVVRDREDLVEVQSEHLHWGLSPDGCAVIRVKKAEPVESDVDEATVDDPDSQDLSEGGAEEHATTPTTPRHRAEHSDVTGTKLAPVGDDLVSRIERLAFLHAEGLLTEDEFSAAKARLIF